MNLFCVIPAEDDATSFYRALQPVSQLRKIIPNLTITHHDSNIKSRDLAHQDVVFIQRPMAPEHVQLIDLCKTLKVKVWTEFDDNLFAVPQSNPAYYQCEKMKGNLKEILEKSDIVSVSTEEIKEAFLKETKIDRFKIKVIPNAHNDTLFPVKEKQEFKPHNVVMWRGTQSHQEDLLRFSEAIIQCSENNKQWFFNFLGYNPFFLVDKMGQRAAHTTPMELFTYHKYIRQIYPNLSIITLSDTLFNRCKSNIAWIESTYVGSVCLVPTWEEWEVPGVLKYHDIPSFQKSLDSLLGANSEVLKKMNSLSWEYIQEHLLLSKVNWKRKDLLEEVLSS